MIKLIPVLILPNQLFRLHPGLNDHSWAILWESPFFFPLRIKIPAHKKKILFHRASMKAYEMRLKEAGQRVSYLEASECPHEESFIIWLRKKGISSLNLIAPDDPEQETRLRREAARQGILLNFISSPGFLLSREESLEVWKSRQTPSPYQFYQRVAAKYSFPWQRDTILVPESLISRNGLKNAHSPALLLPPKNPLVYEAQKYVQKNFSQAFGSASHFFYPVTHEQASDWLNDFLETRLARFHELDRQIHRQNAILFHSLLSVSLNHGLLTPLEVVDSLKKIEDPSFIPGITLFLEKLAGKREWCRGFSFRQEKINAPLHPMSFFPSSVLSGETGMVPFDWVFKRVIQKGYVGWAERKWILRDFFRLLDIPRSAQEFWFSHAFVDSASWAVSANLALGRAVPLFSRQILRMSNFPEGDWCRIWDLMVWRWVWKHQTRLKGRKVLKKLESFSSEELKAILKEAECFLKQL